MYFRDITSAALSILLLCLLFFSCYDEILGYNRLELQPKGTRNVDIQSRYARHLYVYAPFAHFQYWNLEL